VFQLVGDCGGQRIVTADNDVPMHLLVRCSKARSPSNTR
jgi:hypothetical protein